MVMGGATRRLTTARMDLPVQTEPTTRARTAVAGKPRATACLRRTPAAMGQQRLAVPAALAGMEAMAPRRSVTVAMEAPAATAVTEPAEAADRAVRAATVATVVRRATVPEAAERQAEMAGPVLGVQEGRAERAAPDTELRRMEATVEGAAMAEMDRGGMEATEVMAETVTAREMGVLAEASAVQWEESPVPAALEERVRQAGTRVRTGRQAT